MGGLLGPCGTSSCITIAHYWSSHGMRVLTLVEHVKCSHDGMSATRLSNNKSAASAAQQAMDDGNFTGATMLWSATEFEAENLTDSVSFYNVLVHELGTVPGNSAALQDWLATLDPHGEPEDDCHTVHSLGSCGAWAV